MAQIVGPAIREGQISSALAVYLGSLKHGANPLCDGPKLNCFYFFEVNSIEKEALMKERLLNIHGDTLILDDHDDISLVIL